MLEEGIAARVAAGRRRGRADAADAPPTRRIAEDRASLPGQRTARACRRATGRAARQTADAFYGYGQYAEAAELYRAALQKGGEDANLVNIRLGAALALAGQRAEAEAAFRAVTGPRAELAQYWLIWLRAGRPEPADSIPAGPPRPSHFATGAIRPLPRRARRPVTRRAADAFRRHDRDGAGAARRPARPAGRALASARRPARPAPAGGARARRRAPMPAARSAARSIPRSAARRRARSPAGAVAPGPARLLRRGHALDRRAVDRAAPGSDRATGSTCCRGSARPRAPCSAIARISTVEVRHALSAFGPSDFVLEDEPRRKRSPRRRRSRSERIRRSASWSRGSRPSAGSSEDAAPVAPAHRGQRAEGFRWETGTDGLLLWVEGAPRGPLVGQSIACDRRTRPAWRRRPGGGRVREARAVPRRPLQRRRRRARLGRLADFGRALLRSAAAAASRAIAAPRAGRGSTRSPASAAEPRPACSAPNSRPIRCAS